jgi:hypothetical protein
VSHASKQAARKVWLEDHVYACATQLIDSVSKMDFVEFDTWYTDLLRLPDTDEDSEEEYQDPLTFYIVSEWFAARLREHGHPATHDFYGINIWGRRACGQARYIDRVVEDIYDEYLAARGLSLPD